MEISLQWTSFFKAVWIWKIVKDFFFFLPQKERFNIDHDILK